MLDPATPNADRANRSAAKSRAVNRELTWGQYGISPVAAAEGRPRGPLFLAADPAYLSATVWQRPAGPGSGQNRAT